MPLQLNELIWRFSTKNGSAGHSQSSTGAGSLGRFISTSSPVSGLLHDLFDLVTSGENTAQEYEYRCIFLRNASVTSTYIAPKVWISAEVAGGATVSIAVDSTPASVVTSGSDQALSIANEDVAPAGLTFSAPTTENTGLALGDIPPGYCKAIWVRRKANDTAAVNNDGATLSIKGDTAG